MPLSDNESAVERQRAHFNSVADRYRKARTAANHLILKDLIWSDMLSDLGYNGRRIKVLEPMCGMGEGFEILSRYVTSDVSYSGFDYSEEMVDSLKTKVPSANVWHADATTFKPERDAYDVIILIGGLHHTPGFAGAIVKSLSQGLRSEGLFINFEPTHGNALFRGVREYIYRSNSLFDSQTERAFAVEELLGFFSDAGLNLTKIRFPGLISYVLYYNPDAFPALNFLGGRMVKATFAVDRLFYTNSIGRFLSFATLSIWRKPPANSVHVDRH